MVCLPFPCYSLTVARQPNWIMTQQDSVYSAVNAYGVVHWLAVREVVLFTQAKLAEGTYRTQGERSNSISVIEVFYLYSVLLYHPCVLIVLPLQNAKLFPIMSCSFWTLFLCRSDSRLASEEYISV